MKKSLLLLAIALSVTAIVLAVDPGRFAFAYVDAGGHSLRMLISGHGSPAVIFETGGSPASGSPLEAWERVQPAVSKFTTTVSYDRAGIGLSALGPKPRDARQVARELHTALHNAHVSPPYLLVGHSFGGIMIRVFADMYPDEAGGMVLVDPTQEEFVTWDQARNPNQPERQDDEWKDIKASLSEASESRVPPGIPVVLITGMKLEGPPDMTEKQIEKMKANKSAWLKFHEQWLEKIPGSRHIVTKTSGHFVPFEQPELVIGAIQQVVERVRNN